MSVVESKTHVGDLRADFQENWRKNSCWKPGDHFFLACSGGLDSVVLANLLRLTGVSFSILHCNFQLRGEESERDESFVRELAASLGVDCQVRRFNTRQEMISRKKGVQETARILRYDWFESVLKEADQGTKGSWLMTAHHAGDQLETIVMNFFRGTGIDGLKGMSFRRDQLLRPLLFAERATIRQFAITAGIDWVEDSSNADVHYTRNLFRQVILPEIEKVFPQASRNVLQTASHLETVAAVYDLEIERQMPKLLEKRGDHYAIPVNKLKLLPQADAILYEICKKFGFRATQVDMLKNLLGAATGKFMLSESHRILKNREWLLIHTLEAETSPIIIDKPGVDFVLNGKKMGISVLECTQKPDSSKSQAWLDLNQVVFPLIIRPLRQGDYFYPLGMRKKKKISRYLTDLKLSRLEKERQWVVESDKKIIWVVEQRIDDRFKITDKTKSILLIKPA